MENDGIEGVQGIYLQKNDGTTYSRADSTTRPQVLRKLWRGVEGAEAGREGERERACVLLVLRGEGDKARRRNRRTHHVGEKSDDSSKRARQSISRKEQEMLRSGA